MLSLFLSPLILLDPMNITYIVFLINLSVNNGLSLMPPADFQSFLIHLKHVKYCQQGFASWLWCLPGSS